MRSARTIRFAVFVDEQKVPAEIEIDEHDREDTTAVHALALIDAQPVGTGRFYVRTDGGVQIGRMAVLADRRGHGIGRALLDALVAAARKRSYSHVVLHAQTHAIGFYERAGFFAHGPEFDDAGIAHVEMILSFAESSRSLR
ncbi:MAG: GNAT family N-acetyltransferase [Vulcanimicrobiaceae bacterium]